MVHCSDPCKHTPGLHSRATWESSSRQTAPLLERLAVLGVQMSACCQLAAAEMDGGNASPALAAVHLRRAAHELAQGAAAGNMRAGGRVPRGDRLSATTAPDGQRHLPPAAPLPLLLHRLGAALLRRRGTTGAAAGAAAAAALRAASAPLRGAAAHWLRRGEAALRAGMAAPDPHPAEAVAVAPLLDAATAQTELSHAFWDSTDTAVHLPGCLPAHTGARSWSVNHTFNCTDIAEVSADGITPLPNAAVEPLGIGAGNGKQVKGGVRGTTAAVAGAAQQTALKQEKAQRVAREGFLDEAEACFCNALLLLEEEALDAASCEREGEVPGSRAPHIARSAPSRAVCACTACPCAAL